MVRFSMGNKTDRNIQECIEVHINIGAKVLFFFKITEALLHVIILIPIPIKILILIPIIILIKKDYTSIFYISLF